MLMEEKKENGEEEKEHWEEANELGRPSSLKRGGLRRTTTTGEPRPSRKGNNTLRGDANLEWSSAMHNPLLVPVPLSLLLRVRPWLGFNHHGGENNVL